MPEHTKKSPLVLFGFDAGDPQLMKTWANDGSMPTLQSIMERGSWGKTAGPEMLSEHGIWVTLTSGVSRGEHGYYYHRQLVPGTYGLAPATGRDSSVEPFWRRLPPEMKIAVVDVPDIAALAPQAGFQISEWATHYPYSSPSTHPPELLNEVRQIFGRQTIVHENLNSSLQEDHEIYDRLTERIRKKGELCRRLIARDEFDLIFIVFSESHTGGHQFWKYHLGGATAAGYGTAELASAIRRIYQAIDSEIGRTLSVLPEHANVFALSSVGMKSQFPAAGLGDAFCRGLGYQATPTANDRGQGLLPMLRRVIPTPIRDQLSRLLRRETQERWISQKYEASVDWTRTEAFCVPSYYTSFLRVNLKGREPEGTVEPGAQYDETLDRLQADLEELRDPISGGPAVLEIARSVDLFGGNPPETLPDLFVEWIESDHFMDRIIHPNMELRQTECEFHRGSDHSRFGFVAAAGSGIESLGDLGEIDPLDLAPTFLALLGVEDCEDLQGKPIMIRSGENQEPIRRSADG